MAAPAWVKNQSSTGGGAGTDTTVTPTLPGSLTVGNMLILAIQVYRSTPAPTLTTPSGWTRIIDGSATTYGFNFCRLFVFAKAIVGGETNPSMTSNPVAWLAEISEFTGADTNPANITAAAGTTTAGTSIATPAVTTPSADNLLVWVESQNTNFNDITAGPTGSTLRVNVFYSAWGLNVAVADKTQVTAATVAAGTFTRSHVEAPAIAHSLALQPPAAAASTFVPQIIMVN